MNDPKKEKTLKEWYNRIEEYDPSDEEVRAKYDDDFNEWFDNFLEEDKK